MARDREKIEPQKGDQQYARRDERGRFTDSHDEVGRSLSPDRQREAKTTSKKGRGDRGNR